jgi:hypothetical protein
MDFELTVDKDKHFITLKVNRDIDLDVAKRFTTALAELAEKTGIYNCLSDVRNVRNVISVIDNYDYGYKSMSEMGIKRSSCCAILVSPGDSSHDLIETVTQNAGYITRKFTDEAAAIEWLSNVRRT